jgi:hypothetical protein
MELSVEDALRAGRPETRMPPGLHDAIMNEVRFGGRRAPRSSVNGHLFFLLRWISVPALAAIALATFWFLHGNSNRRDLQPGSPLAMGSVLILGDAATRTFPPAVISPLTEELQRVNLDFEKTARHLLASLP